jgi:hypothetical protein
MSNVAINIAAEFIGKKAFKQAETSTDKLSRSVKRLAGSLGIAFGVRGIGRSIKAFAEDDKAAQALGQTLNNLGLAYGSSAATVNGYISRLEQQTGVLDDELRPAMDRFLRATMSVTKSQELLNLALDISAGTGKSLTQVSQSLQKGYLGQTQALGRLGVGLSKAELTSSSFEEIQQKLSVLFAGQASVAAGTYAGEIAKLQVAVNNAKETIGKGFVDALKSASGSNTIDPVISGIGKIANAFAALTRETGKFVNITKSLFDPKNFFFYNNPANAFKGMGNISISTSSQDTQKADAIAASKAAAAQTKATQALTKTTKENLKLAKAKAIFDLQKIQIEAALKGKISEEDRIRLLLLRAIAEENMADIEKYTKMLDEVQGKVTDLQDTLAEVYAMDAGNPFISWEIGLDGVQRALITINDQSIELTNTLAQNSLAMGLLGGASFAQALSGARYAAQAAAQMGVTGNLGDLPPVTTTTTTTPTVTAVTVNVAGTVTAQADLEKAIQDAINSSNASGTSNILAPKTWRGEV